MSNERNVWMEELLELVDRDSKMTEKQGRIVQAAIEVFAEKGFASTSTSEIAKKAGVAEGTIFRHYKTKKDLLLSIVAPVMVKLAAPLLLRDFIKVLDAKYTHYEDFLRAVIKNRLEFVKKHLPVLKVLLQEIPFQPELREQFKETVVFKVGDRVRKIVEHFQQQGQIIKIPANEVIRLFVSTVLMYFAARFMFLPELEWDEQADIDRTIDFIMYGLSAEPRPVQNS